MPAAPSDSRRFRRLARRVIVFALIGLVCTLVTAWPLPLLLLNYRVIQHDSGTLRPWMSPSGNVYGARVSRLRLSDWYILRPVRGEDSNLPFGDSIQLPAWAARPGDFTPPEPEELYEIHTAATGWPLRALASEAWECWRTHRGQGQPSPGTTEHLRWNIYLLTSGDGKRVILPLRPIWIGLLGDIALYAVAAWALAAALDAMRGVLRQRKGRCRACGYDLTAIPANSPCPECGEGRAARA